MTSASARPNTWTCGFKSRGVSTLDVQVVLSLTFKTGIIENLNSSLSRVSTDQPPLQYMNSRWLDFTAAMLSTMKDILEVRKNFHSIRTWH